MKQEPASALAPPAQIAKAALRRLAMQQLEPTPENFARAYAQEAGVPSVEGRLPARARPLVERLVARAADGFLCAVGAQRCTGGELSACVIAERAAVRTAPLSMGCVDNPSGVGIAAALCDEGTRRPCRAVEHWDRTVTACFAGHQRCEGGVFLPCLSDESIIQPSAN